MKKINLISILKYFTLSLIVALIAIFFMSYKANLDIDEAYTYGLANNAFQMNIENFKEYSGEELLIDYVAVKDGKQFDVKNVFFNQKNDTHPPLYFLLINFICSLHKLNFSMWYGLYVNIIFLIVLFWGMAYLLDKIINNKLFSVILSYASLFLYGFINSFTFTRMYVMLSAISTLFVCIVINYICNSQIENAIDKNKKNFDLDLKFTILFYIVCVLGILTQYHFMITAGFFSIVSLIHLIKIKNYKQLLVTIIAGVLSIVTSIAIFPDMINHIFNSSKSSHAISSFATPVTLSKRVPELITGLCKAFFGMGLYVYIIILVIGIIILMINKKKRNRNFFTLLKIKWLYFTFLLSVILYFIVICFTVKFSFQRYLYNIYPLLFIIIISPIYLVFTKINKYFAFISIVIMLMLGLSSNYHNSPTSLNIEDSMFAEYLYSNRDTKMILLYRTTDSELRKNTGKTSLWKMPSSLYIFKDMKNMTFVDISNDAVLNNFSNSLIEGYNDILLVIYTSENDDYLIRKIMEKNNVSKCERVYFTTYYHMYRLR